MEDKKQKQREAVRKYEANHDRLNILFPKGTRDRIRATGLDCTAPEFVKFSVDFLLNYIEQMAPNGYYCDTDSIKYKE